MLSGKNGRHVNKFVHIIIVTNFPSFMSIRWSNEMELITYYFHKRHHHGFRKAI